MSLLKVHDLGLASYLIAVKEYDLKNVNKSFDGTFEFEFDIDENMLQEIIIEFEQSLFHKFENTILALKKKIRNLKKPKYYSSNKRSKRGIYSK